MLERDVFPQHEPSPERIEEVETAITNLLSTQFAHWEYISISYTYYPTHAVAIATNIETQTEQKIVYNFERRQAFVPVPNRVNWYQRLQKYVSENLLRGDVASNERQVRIKLIVSDFLTTNYPSLANNSIYFKFFPHHAVAVVQNPDKQLKIVVNYESMTAFIPETGNSF
jgi:hypothetical protein